MKFIDFLRQIVFLQTALKQTGYLKNLPTEDNWKEYLVEVVEKCDWKVVHKDVVNFLEDPNDMYIFTKENVLNLLKKS